MTDFKFESDKIEDPEVVSEFSMEGYEKYRLKTGELTIDLAIVDMENKGTEEYIEQRKKEISSSETEVPHPYKPEKKEGKKGENLIKFQENPLHGQSFADPEYNLVSNRKDKLVRYNYLIIWTDLGDEKLAEVEFYSSKEKGRNKDELIRTARSLKTV